KITFSFSLAKRETITKAFPLLYSPKKSIDKVLIELQGSEDSPRLFSVGGSQPLATHPLAMAASCTSVRARRERERQGAHDEELNLPCYRNEKSSSSLCGASRVEAHDVMHRMKNTEKDSVFLHEKISTSSCASNGGLVHERASKKKERERGSP
ncbi:hypothetical protein GOP47_0001077, partial [Adiantum capillus-veneris]